MANTLINNNRTFYQTNNSLPTDPTINIGDKATLLNGDEYLRTSEGWKITKKDGSPLISRSLKSFSELDNINDYTIGEKLLVSDRGVEFEVKEQDKSAVKAHTLGTAAQCASYTATGLSGNIGIGDTLEFLVYMDDSEQTTATQCNLFAFDDDNAKGRFAFRSYQEVGKEMQVFSVDNLLWTITKIEDYYGNDLTGLYNQNILPINKWYRITFTSLIAFSYSSIRLFNNVPSTVTLRVSEFSINGDVFPITETTGESISNIGNTITLNNVNSATSPTIFESGIDSNDIDLILKNGYSLQMNIVDNTITPQMLGYIPNETKVFTNDVAPILQQCIDSKYDVRVPAGNYFWGTAVDILKPKTITFEGTLLQDIVNAYGNFSERPFDYVGNKEACVLYTNVDNLNMLNIKSPSVTINRGNFDLTSVQDTSCAIRFDADYRLKDVYINNPYIEGNLDRLSIAEGDVGFIANNGSYGIWLDTENATIDGGYFFNCYITASCYYLRQGLRLMNFNDNPNLSTFFSNGLTIDINGDGCAEVTHIEGLNNSIVKSYSQDRPHFNFTDSGLYPFYLGLGDSEVDVFIYDSAWGASYNVQSYVNQAAFPVTGVVGVEYYAEDEKQSYDWNGSSYDLFRTGGYTHFQNNIYNPQISNVLVGRASAIYDFRTRRLDSDLGRYRSVTKELNDVIYDKSITRNLNNVISHAALEGTVTVKVFNAGVDMDWVTNGTNLYPADDAINNPDGALTENTTPSDYNMTGLLVGNIDNGKFLRKVQLGVNEFLEIHIINPSIISNLNRFKVLTNLIAETSLVVNGTSRRVVYSSTGDLINTAQDDNPQEFILRIWGTTSTLEVLDIYATTVDDVNLSVIDKTGGNVFGNLPVRGGNGDAHTHIDIADGSTYVEFTANETSFNIDGTRTLFFKNTSGSTITFNFNSFYNNRHRGSLIFVQLTSDSDDITFDTSDTFDKMITLSGSNRTLSGGDWIIFRLVSLEGLPNRAVPYELANSLAVDTTGETTTFTLVDGTVMTVTNGLLTLETSGTPAGDAVIFVPRINQGLVTDTNGIVTAHKIFYPDNTPASPVPYNGTTIPNSGAVGEWFSTTVTLSEETTIFENGTNSLKITGLTNSFGNARFRVPSIAGQTFRIRGRWRSNTGQGRLRCFNGVTGDTDTLISGTDVWEDLDFTTTTTQNDSFFDLTFYPKDGSGDQTGFDIYIDRLQIDVVGYELPVLKETNKSGNKTGAVLDLSGDFVYNAASGDTKNATSYSIINPKTNNSSRCLVQFTQAEIDGMTNNIPSFTGFTVTEVGTSEALIADTEMYMTVWCDDDSVGNEIIRMKINAI